VELITSYTTADRMVEIGSTSVTDDRKICKDKDAGSCYHTAYKSKSDSCPAVLYALRPTGAHPYCNYGCLCTHTHLIYHTHFSVLYFPNLGYSRFGQLQQEI